MLTMSYSLNKAIQCRSIEQSLSFWRIWLVHHSCFHHICWSSECRWYNARAGTVCISTIILLFNMTAQLHLERAWVTALSWRLVFRRIDCFTVSYVVKSAICQVTNNIMCNLLYNRNTINLVFAVILSSLYNTNERAVLHKSKCT